MTTLASSQGSEQGVRCRTAAFGPVWWVQLANCPLDRSSGGSASQSGQLDQSRPAI